MAHISLPNASEASNESEAYIQGGSHGMLIAADTRNVSRYGHITNFPGDEATLIAEFPVAGNKVPTHLVLHRGSEGLGLSGTILSSQSQISHSDQIDKMHACNEERYNSVVPLLTRHLYDNAHTQGHPTSYSKPRNRRGSSIMQSYLRALEYRIHSGRYTGPVPISVVSLRCSISFGTSRLELHDC